MTNCASPLCVSDTVTGPARIPGPVLVMVSVPEMTAGATKVRLVLSDAKRLRTSGFGATLIEGGAVVAVSVAVAVSVSVGLAVGVSVFVLVLVLVAVAVEVKGGVGVLLLVAVRVAVRV